MLGAPGAKYGLAVPRPIEISDYHPHWVETFSQLRNRLQQIMGSQVVSIEHVGSTAVPGLAAKPIIDLDMVIGALAKTQFVQNLLQRAHAGIGGSGRTATSTGKATG
jgi:GrpB-like predicted nucleotidyltransferase (UPF0157 family)